MRADEFEIWFVRLDVGESLALELGIGTGRLAVSLASNGVTVHGIDASEAMILQAKPGGASISNEASTA
jgi:2-polyprenyl-3-methyl-5-hydroxy-6-metoxy-1,4-benzoquinol methylase